MKDAMELVKWMIHSFVVSALTASEADTAESALQMFPSLVLCLWQHTQDGLLWQRAGRYADIGKET